MKIAKFIPLLLLLFSFVACETGEFDDNWGGSSSSSSSGSSGGSSGGSSDTWTLYKSNYPAFTVVYISGSYSKTEKQSVNIYTANSKYWIKYGGSYYTLDKNTYSSLTGCPVSLSGYQYCCFCARASGSSVSYYWFVNL